MSLAPIRHWRIAKGGIRPIVGPPFSLVFKTQRFGVLGKDWWTDAVGVYDFGFFIIFDHRERKTRHE